MNFSHTKLLHVNITIDNKIVNVGRFALKEKDIFFEYNHEFILSKLEISPFKLPLKSGVTKCPDRVFDGLFGVFNDSLPDGWGRLLLDRKLLKEGITPNQISPLDRLSFIGQHALGALQYEPEIESHSISHKINLDILAEECIKIQEEESFEYVDDLFAMNGSSAGARPKILVEIENKKEKNIFNLTQTNISSNKSYWIIKFPASHDTIDIGAMEYAYHLMAKEAGLDVPEAQLFPSKKGPGYFGVKRFDRVGVNQIHTHTISGLLHADHRIPSLDYETIMRVTLRLTKSQQECEKQFRNITFNIFAHNRDDHAKNFSFLMDSKGIWTVSPAYDLTFSFGPGGEHCTTIMGEGKNPGAEHLKKLAKLFNIENSERIIEQTKSAIASWTKFAKSTKVGKKFAQNIEKILGKPA